MAALDDVTPTAKSQTQTQQHTPAPRPVTPLRLSDPLSFDTSVVTPPSSPAPPSHHQSQPQPQPQRPHSAKRHRPSNHHHYPHPHPHPRHHQHQHQHQQQHYYHTHTQQHKQSPRHERAASVGSVAPNAISKFSLSDFSLGRVLGSGGTATVIRAELVTSTNPQVEQQQQQQQQPRALTKRRQSERLRNSYSDLVQLNSMWSDTYSSTNDNSTNNNQTSSSCTDNLQAQQQPVELALKVVQKKALSKRAKHYLTREIMIHRSIQSHVNIVSLHDVFEDASAIYLVEELLKGGDLYSILKRENKGLSERNALAVIEQVLEALSFMHKHGFAHRDIKPENIMFIQRPALHLNQIGSIKLIDFGLACARDPKSSAKERQSAEKCGTVRYAAPEVIMDDFYMPELVDMWSVGIVLYSIIAHRNPFTGRNEKEVVAQIASCAHPDYTASEWNEVSLETKCLINKLLSRKPSDRPSAGQALKNVSKMLIAMENDSGSGSENEGDSSGASSNVEGDDRDERNSDEEESSHHTPNLIDGLLALFSGNSKDHNSNNTS